MGGLAHKIGSVFPKIVEAIVFVTEWTLENFVITMQTVTRKCSVRPQQSGHLQVNAKSLKLPMSSAIMTLNAR